MYNVRGCMRWEMVVSHRAELQTFGGLLALASTRQVRDASNRATIPYSESTGREGGTFLFHWKAFPPPFQELRRWFRRNSLPALRLASPQLQLRRLRSVHDGHRSCSRRRRRRRASRGFAKVRGIVVAAEPGRNGLREGVRSD